MRFIRNVILIAAAYNLAGCGEKSTGGDQENELNEEEDELEGVSSDAGRLQVGESGCETKDVELRKKFDENKKRLAVLDKQLADLKGSVGTCQIQSSALKAKVDTALDERISSKKARLAKLRGSVVDYRIEIEKIRLQLLESGSDAELEERISDLQGLVRENEERENDELISQLGSELKIEMDSVEAALAAHKSNMKETEKRRPGKKIERIQSQIDRLSRNLGTLKQQVKLLNVDSARIIQLSADLEKVDNATVDGALAVRFGKLRAQMRHAEAVEREHLALAAVIVVLQSEDSLYEAYRAAKNALQNKGLNQEEKDKNEEIESIVAIALMLRQDAVDLMDSFLQKDLMPQIKRYMEMEAEMTKEAGSSELAADQKALIELEKSIQSHIDQRSELDKIVLIDRIDALTHQYGEAMGAAQTAAAKEKKRTLNPELQQIEAKLSQLKKASEMIQRITQSSDDAASAIDLLSEKQQKETEEFVKMLNTDVNELIELKHQLDHAKLQQRAKLEAQLAKVSLRLRKELVQRNRITMDQAKQTLYNQRRRVIQRRRETKKGEESILPQLEDELTLVNMEIELLE